VKPNEYAQARANETGRPYLITGLGHAWMDCPMNRKLAKSLDPATGEPAFGGIVERIYPNYSQVG
jgi:hypothetical protein